ncbi:MAG: hypothetical protein J6R96_03235 [Spirochaetaceae bacterium]|nr:hypothetical protein [Spirochaetaceae bacterium]
MYLTYTSRMMECRQDGFSEGLATGREEGISIGMERGVEKGLERGAYQNKLETAKLLLNYGDSPEKVAICTGLPLDVVQGLL